MQIRLLQAIRNSKRPMMVFLTALLLSQMAGWIYWLKQTKLRQLRDIGPHVGTCTDIQIPRFSYAIYLSFGIFELVTLLLTIQNKNNELSFKQLKSTWQTWRQTDTSLTQRYYQDTILHHILCLLFITGEVVWTHIVAKDNLFNVLTSPM